ncbi:MAG TPA: hypothetical protein VKP30_26315 [Polyangiaceae bacterium]|nr:hypothetical protein [Polyangiaceae bacterium]
MTRSPSPDYEKALILLKAALGEFKPGQPLKRILSNVPDFGPFEWMLTILGLEIDLRVDIPESLADNQSRSASEFCTRVAKLPKVDSPGYTLECLGMVAQALLSLELGSDPGAQRSAKGAARKKASRRAAPSGEQKASPRVVPSKKPSRRASRSTAKQRSATKAPTTNGPTKKRRSSRGD